MLIRDWMTKDVITVTPETSMMHAAKLLKDHNIGRLPVVDESGRLVGVVSDRDIKAASPSKATTLDVHELYYLLDELRIKDIMSSKPIACLPTDTVERCALLLTENNIGGLPVVDESNRVIGVITDTDVFRVLIAITGVRHGGVQLAVTLSTQDGALMQVLEALRDEGARIVSILTAMESLESETREVYIRMLPMDRQKEDAIVEKIRQKYPLVYWARDQVHPLV
ncbi:CBS and ACT domain-containing protein [Megalodesulfovibrio paquesii]